MTVLVLASALFVGIHVTIAGTRLRDALVAAIGERGYLAGFSLLSIGALTWMIMSYAAAPRVPLWITPGWLRDLAMLVVLAAVVLAVIGLITPSPTVTGGAAALERDDAARGILRVTRHPFLTGVAAWAAMHLLLNGDGASLVFFGALLILALIGPPSIDAKRRRAFGARWERFAARTSIVPVAAVVAGRAPFSLAEIGLWRIAVAVLAALALLVFHGRLFGVPALPF
jgi:uncharacterized membrane protein